MGKKDVVVERCFSCGAEDENGYVHPWRGRGSVTLGLAKRLEAGEDPSGIAAELASAGSKMVTYPICDKCHQNPTPGLKLHYYPTETDLDGVRPAEDGSLGMSSVPPTTKA